MISFRQINPALRWGTLAILCMLILFFPLEFRFSLWSAPLDSYPALFTSVILLFVCWTGSGLQSQPSRRFWSFAVGLISLLIAFKLVLYFLMPVSGVEARLVAADKALDSPPIVSPLRPTGPNRLPVYRNASVAPNYINDIRRFDFYTPDKPDRHNYGTAILLQGFAIYRLEEKLLASDDISSVSLQVSAQGEGDKFILSGLATTAHAMEIPWLQSSGNAQVFYVQTPAEISYAQAVAYNRLCLAWNVLFCLGVLVLGVYVAVKTGKTGERGGLGFLPILGLIVGGSVPINRELILWLLIPGGTALVFSIYLIARYWSLIASNGYRLFHAVLSLVWFGVWVRFYADRYPGGFTVLWGGTDNLFHYTFAAEILNGDWLHRADAPFSRQFFIRYAMAGVMAFIGEGSTYLLALNALLYAMAGLLLASITRYMRFRYWFMVPLFWLILGAISPYRFWIPTLFPEVFSIVLLLLAVRELLNWFMLESKSLRPIVIAAVAFSFAVFTRNNYIISAPFLFFLILCHEPARQSMLGWRPVQWKPAILFTVIITVMVGLVGGRNMVLAPDAPPALLISKEIQELALYQGFNAQMTGNPDLIEKYGHLPLKEQFIELLRNEKVLYGRYVLDRILVLFGGPASAEPQLLSYPRFNLVQLLLFGGLIVKLFWLRRRIVDLPVLLNLAFFVPQLALVIFVIGYVGEGYRFIIPCYPSVLAILLYNPTREM